MKTRLLMLISTFPKSVKVPHRYGDGRGGFNKSWAESVRFGGRPTSLGASSPNECNCKFMNQLSTKVMALDATDYESGPMLFHPHFDLSPWNPESVTEVLSLRIVGIHRQLRRTGPNA